MTDPPVSIYKVHYRSASTALSALNTAETGASASGDQNLGDVEVWIAQSIAQQVLDWPNEDAIIRRLAGTARYSSDR